MEKIIDFLNYMYQNAEMGIVGIADVFSKTHSKDLKDLLSKEKAEYEDICKEVKERLKKYEAEVKEINVMAKMGSSFVSSIELAKSDTDSNIARLMIEGTNKGIIEINEKLNNIPHIPAYEKKLAKKLLKTEQNNLDELKKYL